MKIPGLLFGILVLYSACTHSKAPEPKRPNILFILSDDHTSQAWGVYGGILANYAKNEHIKKLTQDGVLLKNAFCTNSICVPSRASILSGKYSHLNGVFELEDSYSPDSLNIAMVLQEVGYQTALIGKWHLKEEPNGFDHYMVLPGQGRYHNPTFITKGNWKNPVEYEGYSADVITDYSLTWLKNRTSDQPFFLCTHFKATHEPFDYPNRYESFLKNVELPYPASITDFGKATTGRTHDGWPLEILGQRYVKRTGKRYPGTSFSLAGLDSLEARKHTYQKFIKDFLRAGAAIDENIGRLIQYLKDNDLYENTLIIYTADQGYFLGEHGFFDKRFIYEESLRMPTVVSYPAEIPAGQSLDDIILNIDFPALILDYANAPSIPAMQGKSFRTNLMGQTPEDWRTEMYYRYWTNQPERPAHLGIRTQQYKLSLFYGQSRKSTQRDQMPYNPGWEFYDLQNDPNELRNAIKDPVYADTIIALKARLESLKLTLKDTSTAYPIIDSLIAQYWE